METVYEKTICSVCKLHNTEQCNHLIVEETKGEVKTIKCESFLPPNKAKERRKDRITISRLYKNSVYVLPGKRHTTDFYET